MKHPFLQLLSSRIVFADGGMGSLLQARGLQAGQSPERWNFDRPEEITRVHRAYFDAGSDFVLTNTFGANPVKLAAEGWSVECSKVAAAAVDAARRARDEAGHGFVALDVGPTGKLLAPLGDLEFETAVEAFGALVRAGAKAGADFVFVVPIHLTSQGYENLAWPLRSRGTIFLRDSFCSCSCRISLVVLFAGIAHFCFSRFRFSRHWLR